MLGWYSELVKRADLESGFFRWRNAKEAASQRLRDLVQQERRRAQAHIAFIRRGEPQASQDRVALVMLERWKKVAAVEGGVTGALGFLGIPINLLLFVYFQIALVVSIAEAYDTPLEGDAGEDALLGVLGRAHGIEDVLRSSPRVLGAIAKAIALKYGFGALGRIVPLIASPIAARLNEKDMEKLGNEALRRFGKVVRLDSP